MENVETKNWWQSWETWTAVCGGVIELINYLLGSEIPNGVATGVATVIMVILRNFKTSEPIKQFNLKLKKG